MTEQLEDDFWKLKCIHTYIFVELGLHIVQVYDFSYNTALLQTSDIFNYYLDSKNCLHYKSKS